MADNKTKPTKLSVAAFIDALTDRTRRADAKALVKLMQSAAGEKPKMWGPSIIGFGYYHYTYDSGREGDMPLIGFSPRKAATVLYNMAGDRKSTRLNSSHSQISYAVFCLKKNIARKMISSFQLKTASIVAHFTGEGATFE